MRAQELTYDQYDAAVNETIVDNPLTRSVRLMAEERNRLGYVTEATQAMILDEELTPVLEVAVHQTGEAFGVVPRFFKVRGNDLIDPHGQSLTSVAERGCQWTRQQIKNGVPGAWKEYQRRTAELNNVTRIAQMPPGTICLEVSANPIDWTQEEIKSQHYTDLTMIRLSFKPQDNSEEVASLNFVLPNLDTPEAVLSLQDRLGIKKEDQTIDTLAMLANPKLSKYDGSIADAAREVKGLLGAVLLEKSVGHSTLRMIHQAIELRREAWRVISSKAQADVHKELLDHIEVLSMQSPQLWKKGMAPIRTGFTKELKDRFLNRHKSSVAEVNIKGNIIVVAASRAVEAGEVYIACGTTWSATEFSADISSPQGRAEVVKSLRENVVGLGACQVCGVEGSLYGCNLCTDCNGVWCDEFVDTGKQLKLTDIAGRKQLLRYKNPTKRGIVELLFASTEKQVQPE